MKSVKWTTGRKRLLYLAILLIVGSVGWSLAHRLWPVFGTEGYADLQLPLTCRGGFLLRNDTTTLSFYNWLGKQQWSVPLPLPDWSGWLMYPLQQVLYEHAYSLSDDGSSLATITVRGKTLLLQQWRNGKMTGETVLPITLTRSVKGKRYTQTRYHVTRRDGGRLLVRVVNRPETALFLCDQHRLIADGRLRDVAVADDGSCCWQNDGTTLSYYAMLLQGHRIVSQRKWSVSAPPAKSQIFLKHGKLMDQFGKTYGPSQNIETLPRTPGELRYESTENRYTLSADGDFVAQGSIASNDTDQCIARLPDFPIQHLAHHSAANIFAEPDEDNSAITPDGWHYALLYYASRQHLVKTAIRQLQLPTLNDPLVVGIFHRSGRRVSATRLRLPHVPLSVAARMMIEPPYFEPAIAGISPDGKALLITTPEPQSPTVIRLRTTLYRRL